MKKRILLLSLLVLITGSTIASTASAQTYTLDLIADLQTPIPGGTGNFTTFNSPVSLGGGDVAFRGSGSSGQLGIYTFIEGTLALVVDKNTPIPGGLGNFTNFNSTVSLGGEDVTFLGFGSSGQSGIYTFIAGTLALAADENTPIPGGSGNFTGFGNPVSLGGGDVTFFGFGSGQVGIYNAIFNPAPVINGFNGGGNILIKNTRNLISISNMTPNKKAAVIWGFKKGSPVIGGGKCAGTVLGINPFQLLAKLKANGSGNVNKTFFVPQTGPSRAFIQILDLASCVPGAVVPVILVND